MRSTFGDGIHVAIIMDGNGRWATSRGLPRLSGHRAGADAVRRTIESAPSLGISVLTLYAFSSDNWRRPRNEITGLMKLLGRYLIQEADRCVANGVRLEAIGRRDRLPPALIELLEKTERKTAAGNRLLRARRSSTRPPKAETSPSISAPMSIFSSAPAASSV
jgi:undecaprenyl diphosphate synthase